MPESRKQAELRRAYEDDELWELHEHHVDLRNRDLYLIGDYGLDAGARESGETRPDPGVDYAMASTFIMNLNKLAHISSEPILVHMKTCGGDVSEGFAIYDAIKTCPAPVVILSYTNARSMSSIILQAADKRVLMPNSYFMFHRGEVAFTGEARAVRSQVQFYERYHQKMIEVYIDAMQRTRAFFVDSSPEDLRAMLEQRMGSEVDVFLSAERTIKWGLADEIFDRGKGTWAQAWKRLRKV